MTFTHSYAVRLTALLCTPLVAFADSVKIGNLYYELDIFERTAAVTYENNLTTNYESLPAKLEIPSEVIHQNIPYAVTSVGSNAFNRCATIEEIVLPSTITDISQNAFANTSQLRSIKPGNTLTSIGNSAFYASGLIEFVTPESVSTIGPGAFKNCRDLKTLSLPSQLRTIESNICENTSLNEIEIPQTVYRIKDCAFLNSKIDSVFIPRNVEHIGTLAFYQEEVKMRSLVIEEDRRPLFINYTDSYVFDYNASICKSDSVFVGRSIISEDKNGYIITEGRWGENPFKSKIVAFGDSVTSIPTNFFSFHCGVERLYIGKNLSGEIRLTDNTAAFTALRYLYVAESAVPIQFRDYNFLESPIDSVYIGRDIANYNGFLQKRLELASVKFGNRVSSIPNRFLYGAINIKELRIPNSVEEIGSSAFAKCRGLETLTLGNGLSALRDDILSECASLTTLVIQDGDIPLTLESNRVFRDAPLATLYLGRPLVYSIEKDDGYSPFYGKNSLTSITVGNNVTTITDRLFAACRGLGNITLPPHLNSIGNSAFIGCESLNTIDIPTDVYEIHESAFADCQKLETVRYGNSMERIGSYAFSGCTELRFLYSSASVPPYCGENALTDIDKARCTLLIPEGSADLYNNAPQWRDFIIVKDELSSIDPINSTEYRDPEIVRTSDGFRLLNADNRTVGLYSLNGVEQKSYNPYNGQNIILSTGIYLLRIGNISYKIAL